MHKLLTGIAAVTLATLVTSAPAQAQGHGQGNGKSQGGQSGQQHGNSGGGGGKSDKGSHGKSDHGGGSNGHGNEAQYSGGDQGSGKHGNGNGGGEHGSGQRYAHSEGKGSKASKDYRPDKADKGDKGDKDRDRYDDDYRGYRGDRDDDRYGHVARLPYSYNRGLIDGCPPGLAKKNPPCVPPGLAKKQGYYRTSYYRPSFFGIRGIGDGRYYYGDGYLYRLGGNNLISGYIPLLGGALRIGNPWPSYYQPAPISPYYVNYYRLGDPRGYRYADNVVYRVDPETAAITSIAALLTGDDFRVGQPMPAGYDVYNVPYSYRSRYYDRPDAYYRYSDGYIYQVDPETRLIAAAIELLI